MSGDSTSQLNRRQLLAAAGIAGVSAAVAGVEPALAHEDPPSDFVIATVEEHLEETGLRVSRLDNGAFMNVQTTSTTEIPSGSGGYREATDVSQGETVIIVAPGVAEAGADSVVSAERVVHCNFGKFSDVKR